MLSAAAASRRDRSSSVSLNVMNRRLMPARSCTSSGYAKTFYIGNVILLQTLRRIRLDFVILQVVDGATGCPLEGNRDHFLSEIELFGVA
jgi:hypothetical protein